MNYLPSGITGMAFSDVVAGHPEPVCVAKPRPGAEDVSVIQYCYDRK